MSLKQLMPGKFQEIPALRDLVAALEALNENVVWTFIEALKNVRDPANLGDRDLALTASMLGFKFDADWFDTAAYVRLVQGLSIYYKRKGTVDFVKFMGWLTDTQFTLAELWTQDYNSFHTRPGPGLGYDGTGSWYLTPHVLLYYDDDNFSPSRFNLQGMFYQMAPINLVLDGVVGSSVAGGAVYATIQAKEWEVLTNENFIFTLFQGNGQITDTIVGGDYLPGVYHIHGVITDYELAT